MKHTHCLYALLLICLAPACDAEQEAIAKPSGSAAETIASRISWTKVNAATSQEALELVGVVELAPDATHALSPPMPARIVSWQIKPGQLVEPGTALAELQIPELQDLQSAQQAAAQLVQARKSQVAARQAEVAAGVRDVAALREAEVSQREATLALNNASAQLAARRPSALLKPAGGGRWRWESQVTGVVERIDCAPGTTTSAQDACLVVVEPRKSAVRIDVPERQIAALDTMRGATWHAQGAAPVEVTLLRRASALDMSSHTLSVYLGAEGAAWTPGRTGRLVIHSSAANDAVLVPRAAVIELDGAPHVFVRGAGDAPVALRVERVAELSDEVIVRGEGLRAGDEVVSRGAFLLKSVALLAQEG
jgi:multidrug efflux pump subunit AcrA (membrane-fusion protein)